MSTSTLIRLEGVADWSPARLVVADFRWPSTANAEPLGSLVSLVAPDGLAERGTAVITPAGLDTTYGGIRRRSFEYQGSVYQVRSGAHGPGVRAGDLLLPPGGRPVLLLGDEDVGAAASSEFLAIRPMPGQSLWIWAVLNSASGRELRLRLASAIGSHDPTRFLSELVIPLPPIDGPRAADSELAAAQASTRGRDEISADSWWSTADLLATEWRIALSTPDPELLESGTPLGQLCEIHTARSGYEEADLPEPGFLPLFSTSVLAGGPVRRWARPRGAAEVASTGDMLVAGVGARNYATAVEAPCLPHKGVFLLRPKDPRFAPALANFLNGRSGEGLRRILLTGSTVPHLRKEDIARIPVPLPVLSPNQIDVIAAPLHTRLEAALWN